MLSVIASSSTERTIEHRRHGEPNTHRFQFFDKGYHLRNQHRPPRRRVTLRRELSLVGSGPVCGQDSAATLIPSNLSALRQHTFETVVSISYAGNALKNSMRTPATISSPAVVGAAKRSRRALRTPGDCRDHALSAGSRAWRARPETSSHPHPPPRTIFTPVWASFNEHDNMNHAHGSRQSFVHLEGIRP